MLTVFHIVSRFDLGGAEQVALSICRNGSPDFEYHLVEVVRADAPYTRNFIKQLEQSGISYHRAHVPLIRFHYVFERLAALLFPLRMLFLWLRYRPQAVHLHTEVPDMAYTCFAKVFPFIARRMCLVRTVHSTVLWSGLPRTARIVESFIQLNARQAAVSQAVADAYEKRFGMQVAVVRNGVSVSVQKRYDQLAEGKTNVLFAGRMEKHKGIEVLIYIIRCMKDDERFFFHVFGDGSMRDMVEQQLGSLPNVRIGKPLFNLPEVVGSFDYLLMPSEFEGLGLLSVEASLGGALPIVNHCKGLSETVPPTWQLMVDGNKADGYVKLLQTERTEEERKALLSEVRNYVRKHFGMAQMVSAYEALYSGKNEPEK